MTTRILIPAAALLTVAIGLTGCESKTTPATPSQTTPTSSSTSSSDAPSTAAQPMPSAAAQPRPTTKSSTAGDETDSLDQSGVDAKIQPISSKTDADEDPQGISRLTRSLKDETEEAGETIVVIEPTVLDLGEIATGDSRASVVKLTNVGDEPRTLIKCQSSCGCTTANCQQNKVLKPGESMEVEIKLEAGQVDGRKLNKNVKFVVTGQSPITLPVNAVAIAYVTADPAALNQKEHPEGKITVTSKDGQPFSVTSTYPALFENIPTEPGTTHELYLSWEQWEAEGHRARNIDFIVDHPNCDKVSVRMPIAPRPQRADGARQAAPARPDFKRLLDQEKFDEAVAMIVDEEIDVNGLDRQGNTPLTLAAHAGNVEIIQALLDASADVELVDNKDRTPLIWAAQSKNVEAVRLLLDAGADVNSRDNIGNTPLCWAAGFGDAASVQELIDAGSDVNYAQSALGWTPLIWAATVGGSETVRMLIDAGADIEAQDKMERATPLMNAVKTAEHKDAIIALLDAGANLEARDAYGRTVLLVATKNAGADAETIQMLLDAGADIAAVDDHGRSALDLAKKRTDLRAEAVVQLLAPLFGEGTPAEAEDEDEE